MNEKMPEDELVVANTKRLTHAGRTTTDKAQRGADGDDERERSFLGSPRTTNAPPRQIGDHVKQAASDHTLKGWNHVEQR